MNDESPSRTEDSGLDSRLQARLDGALTPAELARLERELAADPRAAARAHAFDRLAALAVAARVTAPAGFADRVMSTIAREPPLEARETTFVRSAAEPRPTGLARLFGSGPGGLFGGGVGWLRPGLFGALALVTVAIAAALLFVQLEGRRIDDGTGRGVTHGTGSRVGDIAASSGAADSTSLVVHRFILAAPGAQKVCLVGDFNGWKLCEVPMKQDASGQWSVELNLPRGRHQYMFVVDDRQWQTDPEAGVRVDDGFGNQNAVVFL